MVGCLLLVVLGTGDDGRWWWWGVIYPNPPMSSLVGVVALDVYTGFDATKEAGVYSGKLLRS